VLHLIRRSWTVSVVALSLCALSARAQDALPPAAEPAPAQDTKVLRFSGIPNQNTSELEAKYKPLAKHLGEKLGIKVEYVPCADYPATVEGFAKGDLQLAWFGGLTGLRAREKVATAKVIACGKIDRDFKSYFIANAKSGLTKSDAFPMELKGKKFTFGSDSSTSGRLMPEHFIRKFTKQTPKEFFGAENAYSGSHDKTAKLVEAGTYDAGALDMAVYDRMVAEFKKDPTKGVDPEKCKVIWVTPSYVDYHFLAHPKLDETFGAGFTDKLTAALLAITDAELLKPLDRPQGLVAATNADFDVLKSVAKDLGLIR